MKKTFFLLINILTMLYCYSQCPKYFLYPNYNTVFDYRNGINLEQIAHYENIVNKQLVKRVVITIIDDDKHEYFEGFYENGLLKKEVSHAHDLNISERMYDDKSRLIKSSNDFEWKYNSAYSREYYYKGMLKTREEVFENDFLTKITRNNFTISLKTGETVPWGKNEEEFYYNSNNHLIRYIENSWNAKGEKSKFSKKLFFYYDANEKLEKIITAYTNDDIRNIVIIFYDEEGLMKKISVSDGNSNLQYEVEFFDYDKYENWHKSKTSYKNGSEKICLREIFYKE